MAVLPDADRATVTAEYGREDGDSGIACTKPNLRAAVNGIDQWLEDNKTALNNAIPQPARGALTTAQKAKLLIHVVRRRWLAGV